MDFHYVQVIENGMYRDVLIEEIKTLFHVHMGDGKSVRAYYFVNWREVIFNVIYKDVRVILYDGKDGHDRRFVAYSLCEGESESLKWREEPISAYDKISGTFVWMSPFITTHELIDIIARER